MRRRKRVYEGKKVKKKKDNVSEMTIVLIQRGEEKEEREGKETERYDGTLII